MKTLILIIVLALAGCASTQDYQSYLAAQADANRLAAEGQKPLVRLMAVPGQAITGLAGLEVYMPTNAPVIQQARPNEWVGVVGQGVSVLGAVMGIKFAGDAATSLADSIGRSSTAGYASVQAPAANVSTITTTTTTTTDASNRSVTDASNRSVTTGEARTITDSYNPITNTHNETATPTVVIQPSVAP